jgi:hypothetical protein
MNRATHNVRRASLLLNAIPLGFDRKKALQVGRMPYEGQDQLTALRRELQGTHVVRRHGQRVEIVAVGPDLELPGKVEEVAAGHVANLVAALCSEWMIAHFTELGRRVIRRRRTLVLVSSKAEDNLLDQVLTVGFSAPSWLGFRAAYELEVRVKRSSRGSDLLVLLDTVAPLFLDATVAEVLAMGIPVENLYVQRPLADGDTRLVQGGRLTGRVRRVQGDTLALSDHDEGWGSVRAVDATLEPRMEVFAHVLAWLQQHPSEAPSVLDRLRAAASLVAVGAERLNRIHSLARYLRRQTVTLCHGLRGEFGKLISSKRRFPSHEVISKPALIFNPSGRRTNRWNQGGLDKHGPFDRYQFNPKRLNIAAICRADLQGRVEQFFEQLLHGVNGIQGGDVGFLRRFALEKPYLHLVAAQDATSDAYRAAAVAAIEHITDRAQAWNLALVQTEEAMEALEGDENPYLVSKAFFLSRGIAVQHVHFETMNQPSGQRAWSLNNIGLACYAKLGGVPWLLPADQTVAHELVIGLGSHQEKTSRFGAGDRYVGVTTVFSGDGRYLLESRTRAVPFEDYGTAMLQAVRAAVEQIRQDFAWAPSDPVRLVFHVFKPVKDVEAQAVHALMSELALPHAEFAFLHVANAHPFHVFDEEEHGMPAGGSSRKGVYAPPRGLFIQLSDHEALLCTKGARELKQATDGHPAPLLLSLHHESSFRDLTYLGRQAFAFSCHSWRSFLPSPLPITILYSQLVANNLGQLSRVSGWSDDAIVGRIGRTRWFL